MRRFSIPYPVEFPWSAALGPASLMAIGGYDGDVTILDLSKGMFAASVVAAEGMVFDVQWLADSRTIVSISGTSRESESNLIVRWWDADTLAPKRSLLHPEKALRAVLSPCGRSAVVLGRTVQLLNLEDGTFWETSLDTERCRLSPNGKIAAFSVVGSRKTPSEIQVWDLDSRQVIRKITSKEYVQSMRFARGGAWLVAGESGQVTVWNTETWECIHRFSTPDDADLIACAEARGLVAVYSYYESELGIFSMTGERVAGFPTPDRPHILEFDPQEQCIVCDDFGRAERVVDVWDVMQPD